MKRIVFLFAIALLICASFASAQAQKLRVGEKFPVSKLSTDTIPDTTPADNTIVVFMPSLTYDCAYSSMLTQSFYYYFSQRLAFDGAAKKPKTKIILIVKDKQDDEKSTQNLSSTMRTVFDENGQIFANFEVPLPAGKNADSTVVLLDANEKIALIDPNYRAQGEHLKPLENKIRELNGIYKKVGPQSQTPLKVGDSAPDFSLRDGRKLSSLRGQVVLVSFYPAAFSGVLPSPVVIHRAEMTDPMSCSIQIDSLDLDPAPKDSKSPRKFVVTSSTDSILGFWRETLHTKNVEYLNDPDYSISLKYFSYNPAGYNNRVSVIVDKKGKVAYIDPDFNFDDEDTINDKIEEFSKK